MILYIGLFLIFIFGQFFFRVYEVDLEIFVIMDIIIYIVDMGSEIFQIQGFVWIKYYFVKEVYGSFFDFFVVDFNVEFFVFFWYNVMELFEKDEFIFEFYMIWKSRGWKDVDCGDLC